MTHVFDATSSTSQFTAIKHDIVKELFLKSAQDAEGLAGICDWLIDSVQLSSAVKADIHAAKIKLMAQARGHAHRD